MAQTGKTLSNRHRSGRHFLQIPGPTNVPDRVLRAIDHADDRPSRPRVRPARPRRARRHEARSSRPTGPVVIYPASGTGAWEAALVNTLSPGDKVLMFETGHFAALWREMAEPARPRRRCSCPATGARRRSGGRRSASCARTRATRSRRSRSSTTRPRPASPAASARCARRSTAPGIRRCSWSTRSRRSPRSTTATTNGASTSPSAARRRA